MIDYVNRTSGRTLIAGRDNENCSIFPALLFGSPPRPAFSWVSENKLGPLAQSQYVRSMITLPDEVHSNLGSSEDQVFV